MDGDRLNTFESFDYEKTYTFESVNENVRLFKGGFITKWIIIRDFTAHIYTDIHIFIYSCLCFCSDH